MARLRKRGEEIRNFILENISDHPRDISSFTSEHIGITRQAVVKHLQALSAQKLILIEGKTKNTRYLLCPILTNEATYNLESSLEEDFVWRKDILPVVSGLPDNVIDILNYSFTEMLNNAIDHSSGDKVVVSINKNAVSTDIVIYDNGEGIFKKIQRELNLHDESHAVLELSKGKLTTDPKRHTGEGIFFTSRMVDDFLIMSGKTIFSHQNKDDDDWILERQIFETGTGVFLKLKNNTSRSIKSVFDKFTSGDNYGFNKTIIPVNLVRYGHEMLVSRSQAKRLLARVDKFKTVILDFEGVDSVGQAFADEIFRVFLLKNKDVSIVHINATKDVEDMIVRALLGQDPQ